MSGTGIVRKVDELGRIVLPIEMRRSLNIDIKDPIEIFVDGDRVVLQKYQVSCVFCGSRVNLFEYCGKKVCSKCMRELNSLYSEKF